ncbi:MAG: tRNA dihydrouridine synthase DusB [Micrococcales bacterium 73-13]|nr:MAG: tRNA dihydrouridine synthase DusB [Micrococcales bacterium 73-13]
MNATATATEPALRPGSRPVLRIGPLELDSPVLLAPMAGITNMPFRRLCAEYGRGLYVTEMITTRALVARNPKTMQLIEHHPSERIRSIQLYGVDPAIVGDAVRILVEEDRVDHVDLNFGCPVPKVTRKGGGAALPWKRDLFSGILRSAVRAAGRVPVTIKMRKGIDDEHLTYLDAGRIAEDAGIAAVALHARTCAQHYSGHADWSAIARLKEHVTSVPVLGNGDVFDGADAVRMMGETGCDGVVVGRGVLGKPWLFGELQQALTGTGPGKLEPGLGYVVAAFRRHAELTVEFLGDERRGCADMRKHVAWYFKGYPVGGDVRARLARIERIADIDAATQALDLDAPYPGAAAEGERGRQGTPKRPHLPDGWLASRSLSAVDAAQLGEDESDTGGG